MGVSGGPRAGAGPEKRHGGETVLDNLRTSEYIKGMETKGRHGTTDAARTEFERAQDAFEAAEDALLDDGEGTQEALDGLKRDAEMAASKSWSTVSQLSSI